MKRARRREVEAFSLSFLDVISCGFGAVILLLVIALALEPTTVEQITRDLRGMISQRESARDRHNEEAQKLAAALAAKERSLAAIAARIEGLSAMLTREETRARQAQSDAQRQGELTDELRTVRQTLSEEMKRLQAQPDYKPPDKDSTIGGIPVDSEYVIFIIDTSGSMQKGAWPLVVRKVDEVLSVHPKVLGIQVMSDMGTYMFPTYAGQWIPDTPGRRKAIVERVKTWQTFSNSSPVEGVVNAIRAFHRKDRRISLYVFGDDFSGKNISDAVEEVARINGLDERGVPRVRIHTFGFPVLFLSSQFRANRERFAHLMRVLAERNAGSFVGLNGLR